MSRYRATFEIDSKSDAHAVRVLVEQAYDAFREESREIRGDDDGMNETLRAFEAIRDAARRPSPGSLTVIYEQYDGELDD